ncbi:MAG: dihydroorotate dehydrogenase-like protein [Gammaproteobacteria bacterium]|nr:dihydroorotate dehydrogenase-like protein [Gammaproteobacteria bacterium]
MDLSTEYLGLKLENPLVPSASPLSRDLATAKMLEDAGASALVMYSLFEEEISAEDYLMESFLYSQDIGHNEADGYLPASSSYQTKTDEYLAQIFSLKQSLSIPVIASLNGVTTGGWVDHALEIQQAGADALELNVYYVAANTQQTGRQVEQLYLDLLIELKQHINIPLVMKLSPYFSSVSSMVSKLQQHGVNGVSLFNRFYQPSIDLETLGIVPELNLSTSQESLLAMRWIGYLYGQVDVSLAATGGIHTSEDVIRMLLSGADVTHLCSTLLKNGPDHISVILAGMEQWMEEHEYESVSQLKGSVSKLHASDPAALERCNYLQVLKSYKS